MGRGETYETDVNFERRAREVYPLLVVETSRPGGDSADGDSGGGGRESNVEGVEGGGSRLETQVDISLEQTRHLPTIRKTFTSSVPGGALLRCSRCNAGPPTTEGVCSHLSTPSLCASPRSTAAAATAVVAERVGNHINDTAVFDLWDRRLPIPRSLEELPASALARRAVKMFPRCPSTPSISRIKRASAERQIELPRAKFQPFNGSEMLRREVEHVNRRTEYNNALIHLAKNSVK